jgi:thiol-disulfide isomerase/thioredoxin
MRTNSIFIICILCNFLTDCTQQSIKENHFILNGKITGIDSGSVILQYGILSAFHSDTSVIRRGGFTFSGILKEPTLAVFKVSGQSNRAQLYLEPGRMSMTVSDADFKNLILEGSKTQQELNSLNSSLKLVTNHDSLLKIFVSQNPKSYLTPYYLYDLGSRNKFSPDSVSLIYNNLDPAVQKSQYGRITLGYIRGIENITPGFYATDFTALDVNNDSIRLSQFRKKNVVILDFWASWCEHCRKSFPHLKSLYNKYHPKGLEIIGIASMDKDMQSWKAAITEDGTSDWKHIATFFQNGQTVNEDLVFDYPVAPIPRTILIDRNGKVIVSWDGYSKQYEIVLDRKLDSLLNK